ncbi:leucine-rich repeat neuronal protein 2-like [Amphibalanus amphitrite]|uniref:leucine-rich repeat neuronal protein 2-like n=1 Tax=Amphibalanus amphitrite TaxID=1232801 RepID=UPI001C907BE2|nr:leucine-rich repeat neuronal protein 2-like [Amphibalanus amphitrite]
MLPSVPQTPALLPVLLPALTLSLVSGVGRPGGVCPYSGSVADCAARNLTSPPSGLSQNTTELLLQHNRLARLDFGRLGLLQRLELLNCSGSGLRAISGSGAGLPSLQRLDLSGNLLSAVSANTFRSFTALRQLDLSRNRIGSVADAGLVLPRLTELDLSHNLLTALTRYALIDLTELQSVDLSHNLLLRVAGGAFAGARNFSRLDLSSNRLSRLHVAALRGLHVQTLDLSDNMFRNLPTEALKAVKFAGVLELSGNPVERLGTRALHKVSARQVQFSRAAPLRRVARHAVDDCPLLERLTLSDNPRLDFVQPEMARRVPRLRHLDLSGNGLLTLHPAAVPDSVQRLDLRRNPLRCDCTLRWLVGGQRQLTAAVGDVCAPAGLSALPPRCAPHVLPLFAENRTERLGESASFLCAGGGVPAASLLWTLPAGGRLSEGQCTGRVCHERGRLTVRYLHTNDSGRYTCAASNTLGRSHRSVEVAVRSPRVVLEPVSVTSTFVTVSWSVTGGAAVLLGQRRATDTNTTHFSAHSLGLQAQSFTFSQLAPGTEYTFSVALQRAEFVIPLKALTVTTRRAGFLHMRGRRRNYTTVIAMAVPATLIVLTCLGVWVRKLHHWRRHRRHLTLQQLARGGGGGVLPSVSNTSDMALLNHAAAVHASEQRAEGPEPLLETADVGCLSQSTDELVPTSAGRAAGAGGSSVERDAAQARSSKSERDGAPTGSCAVISVGTRQENRASAPPVSSDVVGRI